MLSIIGKCTVYSLIRNLILMRFVSKECCLVNKRFVKLHRNFRFIHFFFFVIIFSRKYILKSETISGPLTFLRTLAIFRLASGYTHGYLFSVAEKFAFFLPDLHESWKLFKICNFWNKKIIVVIQINFHYFFLLLLNWIW